MKMKMKMEMSLPRREYEHDHRRICYVSCSVNIDRVSSHKLGHDGCRHVFASAQGVMQGPRVVVAEWAFRKKGGGGEWNCQQTKWI